MYHFILQGCPFWPGGKGVALVLGIGQLVHLRQQLPPGGESVEDSWSEAEPLLRGCSASETGKRLGTVLSGDGAAEWDQLSAFSYQPPATSYQLFCRLRQKNAHFCRF